MSKNFRTIKIQKDGIKCEILKSEYHKWLKVGWQEIIPITENKEIKSE